MSIENLRGTSAENQGRRGVFINVIPKGRWGNSSRGYFFLRTTRRAPCQNDQLVRTTPDLAFAAASGIPPSMGAGPGEYDEQGVGPSIRPSAARFMKGQVVVLQRPFPVLLGQQDIKPFGETCGRENKDAEQGPFLQAPDYNRPAHDRR